MNKAETKKVLAYLSEVYDSKGKTPEHTAAIWGELFQKTPYITVAQAAKHFVINDTRDYPKFPVPGQIIEIIKKWVGKEAMPPTEAWSLVKRAAMNGRNGSRTEFEKLPQTIQEAVATPLFIHELADADKYSESSLRRDFMAKYESVADQVALNG
ncbi:replicative helicase loader/inhibitor, partial [Eubacterium aggregans]|uniref:replicative helicase loader/inhibitor n=1 Tax=Eubacterium aggregans TaxID=81409 RepID=UPI003F32FE6B